MTKISEVKAGDILLADGGFDCLKASQQCEVKNDNGGLYVECAHGRHYLEGQVSSEDGTLVGLSSK